MQGLGNTGNSADGSCTDSQRLAALGSPLGIPLVSAAGGRASGGERFLTVREVAKRLRVCTSTVYKLCAEGRLAHVRVANAIRVLPVDVQRQRRNQRESN